MKMVFGRISVLLVIIQFLCLLLLALTGPVVVSGYLVIGEGLVFLFGVWSIWVMRRSRLNVFPEVLDGSNLISSGPYRLIRHPMYLSLILLSAILLANSFSYTRLGIGLLLTTNLLFKIEWEERLLRKKLPAYNKYASKNWKLLPFIY